MKTPIPRRIFFWTLCISYFFTTSIILFYVFGYRHDFVQKIFVHTGSITLKSNPKTISVHIDDKTPQTKLVNVINDSYIVTGLRPKNHKLTIFVDGYRPWEKYVSIHSGVATEFWNVLLLRNAYERSSYTISGIDDFFPAPEENLFACTKQIGKVLTIQVFDTKKDETTNTFLFMQKRFTQNINENIEWSPTSRDLIVPLQDMNTDQKDYAISYIKTNDSYLLSDYIDLQNLQSVRWDPKEKDVILYIAQNTLWKTRLDFENKKIETTEIMRDVLAYDFADDGIYVFTKDHDLFHDHDVQGKDLKKLISISIPQDSTQTRLDAYDTHRILLLDDSAKELYVYNKGENEIYNRKIGSNIIGANFSDDGKKLLYYSPFEIFVYFTRDWKAQPIRSENEILSITRFSQFIKNVHFAKDYEHIIFTAGSDIKITELDHRGNRITDTIISLTEKDAKIINKQKMDRLYFIDSFDDTRRGLQSIEFPEKISIF